MRSRVGAVLCALVVAAGVASAPAPSVAAPRTRSFGRAIDPLPSYDGARRCDPDAEPGVSAFKRLVLRAYPNTGAGSISRPCSGAASSEHNEGRAWDWGVNASDRGDRRIVDDLFDWLLRTDRFGNRFAMARRVGIMYIIWNRRVWSPYSGWDVYCVQRRGACRDPDDGGERHPHTDHVHFSFTWPGARKQTTFWRRDRSFVGAVETTGIDGREHWVLGRNGSVITERGAGDYGSAERRFRSAPWVDMASTPDGEGYWLLTSSGKVRAFGDAPRRGSLTGGSRGVAIASTPTGRGYWVATPRGRVVPFGDARRLDALEGDPEITGLAAHPSQQGYWALTEGGRVVGRGAAENRGDLDSGTGKAVAIAATESGDGYWIATASGRVVAFGDARHHGDARDGKAEIVGISAAGDGYRLVTKKGRVLSYGDAR